MRGLYYTQELSFKRIEITFVLDAISAVIFLFYLTYHVISKLRGHEINVQMNNYGIVMAATGVFFATLQAFKGTINSKQ